jgi:glycosyltransferase involved in cell wall biosynthesis
MVAMMASIGESSIAGKRVLIIVQNLPVPFDTRVWQEATTLARAGCHVSVICPAGKEYQARREIIDGIAIFRYPQPLEARGALAYLFEYVLALFWQMFLSWRVFLSRGFDVIHACNPPDTIFLIGGFFKFLFRRRFLFDHHDLCPELYLAKFNRRDLFYNLLCLLERATFRLADIVIATNDSYRRIAIERGGKASEQVFVVRSGPRLERMKILPPDMRLKHGRRHLVGYVGVMGKQEGIDYLLRAVRYITKDLGRDDIHFTLVGSGPELVAMQALARELDVDAFVNFTGRAPDAELLAVLNTADVCVNPDEWNEMNDKSTMNKIMEYMALGKPIVQFDVTEGRFSALDASLYAQPNDPVDLARKIIELLGDPARREQMGRFGRARVVGELAWNHEAPKLLAAYQALWASAVHPQASSGATQTANRS